MKLKKCMALFTVVTVLASSCIPAYADQWVEKNGEWYYQDDNGQPLRNTVSYDGYYVDFRGKLVPLNKTEGIDRDREISSNFYFKYLETGDPQYLNGSEYISPTPCPTDQQAAGYYQAEKWYENYYGCANGIFKPTNGSIWTNIRVDFGPNHGDKVYPDYKLEQLKKAVANRPIKSYDENYVDLYYLTDLNSNLYDNGDFTPLSNAKKRGIQVYQVPFPYPDSTTTYSLISKRDAYRIYKEFLDAATAGTENMSERELALHLLEFVKKQLSYSYSEEASNLAGGHTNEDMVLTLLAGSGICANYCYMYQGLCQTVGLECKIEEGTSVTGGRHGWNLVRVDGTWYHVDATWADTDRRYDGLMDKCPHMGSNCQLVLYPNRF
ncbi:MAG: hypothetical protein HFG49_03960 [Lachnospiraceae bacterium]|jgi:hypothetical protein|nr:hypothetical protein [Lachnospiraceae bacterium]